MDRTVEMGLSIVGGTFGIIAGVSLFAFTVSDIGSLFGHGFIVGYGVSPVSMISNPDIVFTVLSLGAIILGLLGIVGGLNVNKDSRKAGKMMLFSGIAGFILALTLWIVPGILLIGASILAFREKR